MIHKSAKPKQNLTSNRPISLLIQTNGENNKQEGHRMGRILRTPTARKIGLPSQKKLPRPHPSTNSTDHRRLQHHSSYTSAGLRASFLKDPSKSTGSTILPRLFQFVGASHKEAASLQLSSTSTSVTSPTA